MAAINSSTEDEHGDADLLAGTEDESSGSDEEEHAPAAELDPFRVEAKEEDAPVINPGSWFEDPVDYDAPLVAGAVEKMGFGPRPYGDALKEKDASAVTLFRLFFSETLLDHIVSCTNQSGAERNAGLWKVVSPGEFLFFLAILLILGIHGLKAPMDAWSMKNPGACPSECLCITAGLHACSVIHRACAPICRNTHDWQALCHDQGCVEILCNRWCCWRCCTSPAPQGRPSL